MPIAAGFDAQYGVEEIEGKLLITTDSGAPMYRVFVTDVGKPARENWKPFIPEAKDKLRRYGIAPPGAAADAGAVQAISLVPRVDCPLCGSRNTERLSAFGATACKALYRCRECREPFEYFKPI